MCPGPHLGSTPLRLWAHRHRGVQGRVRSRSMPPPDPTLLGYLTKARETLQEKRDALEQERLQVAILIDEVDALLLKVNNTVSPGRIPSPGSSVMGLNETSATGTPVTTRQAILKVLASEDRPFRSGEIVKLV